MNRILVLSTQMVPEGRVFGLDSQTLVQIGLQLLNGIILAVVLTYILYKPVKEFMRKRTERILSNKEAADTTMTKANALVKEYDKKIKEIEQERIQIIEAARLDADEERKRILEEAKQTAEAMKQRSLQSVSEDKKRLEEESRLRIIELSSLIAEKYVAKNMDDKTQSKYLEDMIAQLEETSWPS